MLVLSCIISYSTTISKKQRSDDLIIFNDARGTKTDIVNWGIGLAGLAYNTSLHVRCIIIIS